MTDAIADAQADVATGDAPTPAASGRRSRINPVLSRELRSRMRGWRAPIIITVWLFVTAGVTWLVHTANDASGNDPFGDPLANSDLGRGIFDWVLFVMMLVVLFLVPGQAAGAIAGERERQTLLPLQVTMLSTRQLLFGKIAASSAFLVLLMVAAMPVLAVAYVIGGVQLRDIFVGLVTVVATGVLLAAMTTAVSALTKRVQGAVVLSYLLTLAITVGPGVAYGVAALIDSSRGTDSTDPPEWILIPDPFVAVGDVAGDRFSGAVGSPWDGIWSVMHPDRDVHFEEQGMVFEDVEAVMVGPGGDLPAPVPLLPDGGGFGGAGVAFGGMQVDDGEPRFPYWLQSLTAQAVLAGGLLFAAQRRLRTPAEVER